MLIAAGRGAEHSLRDRIGLGPTSSRAFLQTAIIERWPSSPIPYRGAHSLAKLPARDHDGAAQRGGGAAYRAGTPGNLSLLESLAGRMAFPGCCGLAHLGRDGALQQVLMASFAIALAALVLLALTRGLLNKS